MYSFLIITLSAVNDRRGFTPQEIFETLLVALENHKGDPQKTEQAYIWLTHFFAESYQESSEELAEIDIAFAESEKEAARGHSNSHQAIKQMITDMAAEHSAKKKPVTA